MSLPQYHEVSHPNKKGIFRVAAGIENRTESALAYEAKAADLFLCNYPKCGVTWLQNIVWRILNNGERMPNRLQDHVAFIEFDGAERVEELRTSASYNMIKTHLPYSWIPKHPKAKYIYIAREPKDVLVSLYYHIKGFPVLYPWTEKSLSEFSEGFLNGKLDAMDYFTTLREWYLVKDDPSVLFLLYEDLKTNIKTSVLEMAKFLGEEYYANMTANNGELLDRIAGETTVKKMQEECKSVWEDMDRDIPFVRKGIVGDWKNHLTLKQAYAIDEKLEQTSGGCGCEKLWDRWRENTQ